uniref:Uncharacterized protein n=1 Tax=Plectus sambesii TaxID=2011161 RepID=A0A914UQS2_9BILA
MQGSAIVVLLVVSLLTAEAFQPNFFGSRAYKDKLDSDFSQADIQIKRGLLHPLFYHRLSAKPYAQARPARADENYY